MSAASVVTGSPLTKEDPRSLPQLPQKSTPHPPSRQASSFLPRCPKLRLTQNSGFSFSGHPVARCLKSKFQVPSGKPAFSYVHCDSCDISFQIGWCRSVEMYSRSSLVLILSLRCPFVVRHVVVVYMNSTFSWTPSDQFFVVPKYTCAVVFSFCGNLNLLS